MKANEYAREAKVFSRYLIKSEPTKLVMDIYGSFIDGQTQPVTKKDLKILRFSVKHPWVLSYVDSALVLIKPDSEVRRRIYFMFSILESQPEFCDAFFPSTKSSLYVIPIFFLGTRSIIKSFIGIAILGMIH